MHKSILVLEESTMVHDLFESALPREYWDWHIEHESLPENYVDRVKEILPGIIFLSNQDQKNDYAIVRKIRSSANIKQIPILLLTVARDKLDEKLLRSLGIQGFLRKPFESSTLLEQIEVTLQNHSQNFQKDSRNELESIEIVDDELMGLLSAKTSSGVTMDRLEEELDPTMQLHPIEAESMLLDDEDPLVEYEETGIEEDAIEPMPLDEAEVKEFDSGNDEYDMYDLEMEQAETEAIELELEEISLDIDEYDHEMTNHISTEPLLDQEEDNTGIMEIPVITEQRADTGEGIVNVSRSGEIGILEIEVLPLDTDQPAAALDVRDIDDYTEGDTKLLTELNVSFSEADSDAAQFSGPVVENVAKQDESGLPFMELEVLPFNADDLIEIEHTDINDDIDDDFETVYDEEFDDSDLLDISIEGIDGEEDEAISADLEEDSFNAEEIDESLGEVDLPPDNFEDISYSEAGAIVDTDDLLIDEETLDEVEETLSEDLDDDSLLIEDIEEEPVDLPEDEMDDVVVSNLQEEAIEDLQEDEDLQIIEGVDDLSVLDAESDETEPAVIEQDETNNLNIDFEADGTESDEADFSLDEFEDMDLESAQMNIQEMINFRQVMKAKYDISETTDSDIDNEPHEDESLEIDFLSDDEIEHFDLAEDDGSATGGSAVFEDETLNEDPDLLLDEFDDEPDMDGVASADDLEEIDIFADVDDEEISDVDLFADDEPQADADSEPAEDDIFADVDGDEISDVDLFADDEPQADTQIEPAEEGVFTESPEDEAGEEGLLIDSEPQEDSDTEVSADDLFVDDGEIEDDPTLLAENDALIDDTGFEEVEDDLFTDDSEEADKIDLLSDDLSIADDSKASDDEEDAGIGDESDDDLFSDDSVEESDDLFSDALEEVDAADEEYLEDSDQNLLQNSDAIDDDPKADLESDDDLFADAPELLDSSDEEMLEDPDDDLIIEASESMDEGLLEEDDSEDNLFTEELDSADEELLAESESDDDLFTEELPEEVENDDRLLPDGAEEIDTDQDLFSDSDAKDVDDTFEEVALSDTDLIDDMPVESPSGSEMTFQGDTGDLEAISEADEIAIEVPLDVFEISDLKMEDIADDVESDSAPLQEAPELMEDEPVERELTEDIALPSMDEDLPDLPSVFDEDESDDTQLEMDQEMPEDLEDVASADTDNLLEDTDEAIGEGIEILQGEEDFESFPDESDTIGIIEESADASNATVGTETLQGDKKKSRALSPDLRDKLSGMIEDVISETIQTTLHDMLPDMMEKIIQEELED